MTTKINEAAAYIFLCSNSTEKECIERLLFGGQEKYQKEIPSIKPGDLLFLFNYQESLLKGLFIADSNAQMNIESDAWKGQFPWQVKVKVVKLYKPLSRADLIDVLPFKRNKYPPAVLTEEQTHRLKKIFQSKKRLPFFENIIPYTTNDGHRVRSKGEQIIDNWLFENKILHGYETQLIDKNGVPETMYCDFFLPIQNLYIEFWGLSDKLYIKRKEEKIIFYKKNNLNLVEVFPKDLENIDKVLKRSIIL